MGLCSVVNIVFLIESCSWLLHVARSPLSHERPHVESLRHEGCHEPLLWGVGYISSTVMAVEHSVFFLFVLSMCLLDVFA